MGALRHVKHHGVHQRARSKKIVVSHCDELPDQNYPQLCPQHCCKDAFAIATKTLAHETSIVLNKSKK
eukprot:1176610-Amphidinium_carterae.1